MGVIIFLFRWMFLNDPLNRKVCEQILRYYNKKLSEMNNKSNF